MSDKRKELATNYRGAYLTKIFARFSTYMPLNRQAPIDQKHELARRLNEEIFSPVFTVDQDEDLSVAYVLPYAHGLIAGNFVAVVNRFASLLEFIVQTYSDDGLIDFGAPTAMPAVADAVSGPASGEQLH